MTSIGGKAQELIGARLLEHEKLVHKVMGSKRLLKAIEEAAGLSSLTLASGGKVMFCGNGGSAADAQHWAAEIVGRFQKERPGMAALALTTDTSILTAIGNDYGYDRIFARQVEGLGREGDVLVGISTSGNSGNVLAYTKSSGNSTVLVILNLSNTDVTASINGIVPGDYSLMLNSSTIASGPTQSDITLTATSTLALDAKGYRVLVKK